ncbi:hypothetical protein ACP4OV_002108 [Aristida adscensionis]
MGSLLPSEEELLKVQESLQNAARGELGSVVSAELQTVHAALRKMAEVPQEKLDEEAKLWVHNAKELSYDMGDFLDTLLVRPAPADIPEPAAPEPAPDRPNRMQRLWAKMTKLFRMKKEDTHNQILDKTSYQSANEITDFVGRVKDLTHRLPRHRIDDSRGDELVTAGTVDPRLPALYRNEQELVGIDKAIEELKQLLTPGDDVHQQRRRKIVAITGFGGVGKTTLAKAVYNMLQGQFECSAFVPMPRIPDSKKVFKDILLELDEKKYMDLIVKTVDQKQLIDEIQGFLKNKRSWYFLVIDDIWSIESWEKIKSVLIENNCGSRIITTTRKTEVAAVMDEVYRVKPLLHVDSEKLLYRTIFGGEGNCPADDQLAKISDKILENCGGSPLAIITAASVLASNSREEWSKVFNFMEDGHEGSRYLEKMKAILSFSYYDLPSHLRICLLYLSLFPRDYWIERDILIWMWVAEGFVSKEQEIGLFEQGEIYFNELVNRGVIQTVENRYKFPPYGCRAHVTLHNLIHSLSSEENFATSLLGNEGQKYVARMNARRFAMHKTKVEHISETNLTMMRRVRLFTASLCLIDQMPELPSFQVLRVLALEYCPNGLEAYHLKQVGNLVHLRYLSLSGTAAAGLPAEAVQELRLLQTLDLRETGIAELPPAVFGLKHLLCLCADQISSANWRDMWNMTTLEELRICNDGRGNFPRSGIMLHQLKELRVLEIGIHDLEFQKPLVESLSKLGKIQHLEIYSEQRGPESTDLWTRNWAPSPSLCHLALGRIYFLQVLPAWIHPARLQCLSHLHLGVGIEATLGADDLKTLGSLPELRSLVLMYGDLVGTQSVGVGDGFFQKLRFLVTNRFINFGDSGRIYGSPMSGLEDYQFCYAGVSAMNKYCDDWLSSLEKLPSLNKLTVQYGIAGRLFIGELEPRLKQVTSSHPNCPTLELIFDDDLWQAWNYRPKNPRFQALRSEMEKMQANKQRGGEPR